MTSPIVPSEAEAQVQSAEEADHLERSTKKVKNTHEIPSVAECLEEISPSAPTNPPPEVVMETQEDQLVRGSSTPPANPIITITPTKGEQVRSFRAALMREQSVEEKEKRTIEFEESDRGYHGM